MRGFDFFDKHGVFRNRGEEFFRQLNMDSDVQNLNHSTSSAQLHEMLEDSIYQYGYELVHLELTGRDNAKILRLYIDAPGGVTLDDCAFVSGQVSALLDVEDPFTGRYTLEVSSPGVERPLVKKEHFEKVLEENVSISTYVKCDGRKNFFGRLVAVSGDSVLVAVDGNEVRIEFANMRKAHLKPELTGFNNRRAS